MVATKIVFAAVYPLITRSPSKPKEEAQEEVQVYEEEEHHSWLGGSTAVKYLLAGGAAGAGRARFISQTFAL